MTLIAHFGQFEHLLTHQPSPLNLGNLTAKILFCVSFRVCSLIKKSDFRNLEKEPFNDYTSFCNDFDKKFRMRPSEGTSLTTYYLLL